MFSIRHTLGVWQLSASVIPIARIIANLIEFMALNLGDRANCAT